MIFKFSNNDLLDELLVILRGLRVLLAPVRKPGLAGLEGRRISLDKKKIVRKCYDGNEELRRDLKSGGGDHASNNDGLADKCRQELLRDDHVVNQRGDVEELSIKNIRQRTTTKAKR